MLTGLKVNCSCASKVGRGVGGGVVKQSSGWVPALQAVVLGFGALSCFWVKQ